MEPAMALLPAGVIEHVALHRDNALPKAGLDYSYYCPWLVVRLLSLLVRRRKRDWNEVLRINDIGTMDYRDK